MEEKCTGCAYFRQVCRKCGIGTCSFLPSEDVGGKTKDACVFAEDEACELYEEIKSGG